MKQSFRLITKISIIISYYIYSLSFVKHDYRVIFEDQRLLPAKDVLSTTKDVLSTTKDVLSTTNSFEAFRCNPLLSIPGYQDLSFCFQNYSLFNMLYDLKLNSYFTNNIILPAALYLLTYFVISKSVKLDVFLNIIICSFIPSVIGKFFGIGLNGISNESGNMFWNIVRVFYLNIVTNSTETASFGPELRQVASFIFVLIFYLLLLNINTESIPKLILIISLIHIYMSIALFVIFTIFLIVRILKSNSVFLIFYTAHIYISIILQNDNIYNYKIYISYHLIGFYLLFRFGSNLSLNRKESGKNLRYFIGILCFLFLMQIALVLFRYSYLTRLSSSDTFNKLIEYEKGAGVIERVSSFTRTLVYLFFLSLLSKFKIRRSII